MLRHRLLYIVATSSYFLSHRIELAHATYKAGFEVAIATYVDKQEHHEFLKSQNIKVFDLKYFHRSKIVVYQEWQLLRKMHNIYKSFQPAIIHTVALKPLLLGNLTALMHRKIRIINALGGLGYIYTASAKQSLKRTFLCIIISSILKILLRRKNIKLLLQNNDDANTLVSNGIALKKQINIIKGSGIDTNVFCENNFPNNNPIVIAVVTRMLWDKGIGEVVAAAKLLKERGVIVTINLYGEPDLENPTAIPVATLESWAAAGLVNYFGYTENIVEVYHNCDIAVLSSYREGLPKSLLEAASCGKPIITTDVPGCREVVKDNENGFLVPAGDPNSLADAIEKMINEPDLRKAMGKKSRLLAEQFFRTDIIFSKTIKLYNQCLIPDPL